MGLDNNICAGEVVEQGAGKVMEYLDTEWARV